MARRLLLAVLAALLLSAPVPAGIFAEEPDSCPPLLLVELVQPLERLCNQKLMDAGAEIVSFVPPASFLVRAQRGREPIAATLQVVSMAPLRPAMKMQPGMNVLPGSGVYKAYFAGPERAMAEAVDAAGLKVLQWTFGCAYVEAGQKDVDALSGLPMVHWLEPYCPPMVLNDHACRVLGVRQERDGAFANDGASVWSYNSDTSSFEGIIGTGVTISITDTGLDGTHPAFDNKKVWYHDYGSGTPWTDTGVGAAGHGTMCAGIAAGNGAWRPADPNGENGKYAGMAPGAGLIGQSIFSGWTTPAELCRDAVTNGADVTSNSWGMYYPGSYDYGAYAGECAQYDASVRDADYGSDGDQPLVVVFANANEGPTSMTLTVPATSKNVISVGATGNDRAGVFGYVASNTIIYFSSRGPCMDGRIKPDVVAPGSDVYTTCAVDCTFKGYLGAVPDDLDYTSYFVGDGTSAACPYVAGAAGLVIAYWKDKHGAKPSPALTKALLINGAEILPAFTYPGNDQGWGRVNVSRAVVPSPTRQIITEDQLKMLETGDSVTKYYKVGSEGELRISLVWTDRPGAPYSSVNLVNNLDLKVTDPDGNVYRGNNFAAQESVPGGNDDAINNVEGFRLRTPKAGRYTVSVTGASIPDGPQDYALVLGGVIKEVTSDIAAEAITLEPVAPVEGDKMTINATVASIGKTAIENVPYCITVDGNTIASGNLPKMEPGERTNIPAAWTAVRGNHTMAVVLDPADIVDELDETNNMKSAETTVLHFGVTVSMAVNETRLDPGGTVAMEGTVRNDGTARDTILVSFTTALTGWSAATAAPSVVLDPDASVNVSLTVTCPALALAGDTAELELRATSGGNASYTDMARGRATANQLFGIGISTAQPRLDVYPWETAQFNINVSNTGNGLDTVSLFDEGTEPGWNITLSSESMRLTARTDGDVSVGIRSPPDALAGNTSKTKLTATSMGGVSANTSVTVGVKQFYNISLNLMMFSNSTLPGGSVGGIFFIRNTGNGPDNVQLGVVTDPGFNVSIGGTLLIQGYSTRSGNLTITTPKGALAGDFSAYFFVRSEGGILRSSNFIMTVQQVFAVAANSSPLREVIYPGERASFYISVSNLGNGNDSFTVSPEGLPTGFSVEDISGPVPLGAGRSGAARVRLLSTNVTAGELNLTFRALSGLSPRTFNFSRAIVVILEVPIPPVAQRDNTPVARSPKTGGSEMCGVVLVLATVFTATGVAIGHKRRLEHFQKMKFFREQQTRRTYRPY